MGIGTILLDRGLITNDQLEQAMKNAYMNKINRVRSENTG